LNRRNVKYGRDAKNAAKFLFERRRAIDAPFWAKSGSCPVEDSAADEGRRREGMIS
jgi:hypothetical protein